MASLKEQFEELFNLGLQYSENGQFENAIECYDKIIDLTCNKRSTLSLEDFIKEPEKKDIEKVREEEMKELELNSNRAMAYVARGKCEQELKNYDSALSDYDGAIMFAKYSGAIELNLNYYDIGICCEEFDIRNYGMTSSEYKEIVEGELFNSALHSAELNKVCCEMLERAVAEYSKAIELNPSFADAYNHRGNCYIKLNAQAYRNYRLYESLKVDCEFALSDCNHYADTGAGNNHQSFIYSKIYYKRALYDYCKAIELNPRYADAYNNREKFYEFALADFNKAIELNPSFSDAYSNRGNYYAELKNYEYSLADYSEAIKLSDSSEYKKQLCFVASNVAVIAKEYIKAEEYIKQAFEQADSKEQQHKAIYLKGIENAKELEDAHKAEKISHKKLHEKEQEMISFFTHTLRNALASAPESLRQAIRLLGSEDYEKNKKYYK
ncbi:MAG: tetratricopeptide repeat protein, partial [Methylococcales bacterium]